jgi:glycosyltransferase involved in cell wall biosynthesis
MIKLLLTYDVPDWACHGTCCATKLQLDLAAPGRFDCTLRRVGPANAKDLTDFDVVFSTIYYHFTEAAHPKSATQVSSYSYWIRKGWDGGWPHLKQWRYVVAKNAALRAKLTEQDHPRITKLYHVLNHLMFTPGPPRAQDDQFVIGFAGHTQALKGLHLIEKAVSNVDNVRLKTATWEGNRLPYAAMPDFYRSLDAYISMSDPAQEAGPRPAMEAGLCGIPVITTVAGQIGEMTAHEQNGLLVERDVESLTAAISRLKQDRDLHARISTEVRPSYLQKWVLDVGASWADYLTEIAESPPP